MGCYCMRPRSQRSLGGCTNWMSIQLVVALFTSRFKQHHISTEPTGSTTFGSIEKKPWALPSFCVYLCVHKLESIRRSSSVSSSSIWSHSVKLRCVCVWIIEHVSTASWMDAKVPQLICSRIQICFNHSSYSMSTKGAYFVDGAGRKLVEQWAQTSPNEKTKWKKEMEDMVFETMTFRMLLDAKRTR